MRVGRAHWISRTLAAVVVLAGLGQSPPQASGADSADSDSTVNPPVNFEDFVGADECGSCHAQQYELWRTSTHGNAGALPSPQSVISEFDGTVLRFSDATITLEVDDAGRYLYHVDQPKKQRQTFEVAGFVGGGHMMGGGTQASFARFSDGSWRLLPFDYSRHSKLWFCEISPSGEWQAITAELSLDACSFWPPVNNFGPACGNCHSSQMQSDFEAQSQQDQLRFMNLAINCESCHGPGRRHVELMRRTDRRNLVDIGIEPLDLLDKQASVEVCFRCHAMTQKLALGFLPGKPLHDYYALNFFAAGKRQPDGRVRGFSYQEGHLYSDCYLGGSMTCVDCHDPHSQGYRDVDGFPLPGKLDDGQCTDCHPSKAIDIQAHTGHKPGSDGSGCVACHMPFLQHGVFGHEVKFTRSDHTIPIPRPTLDASLGLETACSACHADKPVTWQQQQVDLQHGVVKPHKPIVATVIELERSRDPQLAERALLQEFAPHPSAQFDLLRLAGDILSLPGPTLTPALRTQLEKLVESGGRDASALAQSWLIESTPGSVSGEKMTLSSRRRVALWLFRRGLDEIKHGGVDSATGLWEKSLQLDPERLPTYLRLAEIYELTGRHRESLNTLRSASSIGLHTRDEYLSLVENVCDALDRLSARGMQRNPAIDRTCSEEARRPAVPAGTR